MTLDLSKKVCIVGTGGFAREALCCLLDIFNAENASDEGQIFFLDHDGKGVKDEKIDILKKWVQGSLQPNLTFLFDLSVDISIERLNKTRTLDKFEREDKNFHENIRQKYLMLAKLSPERFCILNSEKSIEKIQNQIKLKLDEVLR